jgi:hypothetical protein
VVFDAAHAERAVSSLVQEIADALLYSASTRVEGRVGGAVVSVLVAEGGSAGRLAALDHFPVACVVCQSALADVASDLHSVAVKECDRVGLAVDRPLTEKQWSLVALTSQPVSRLVRPDPLIQVAVQRITEKVELAVEHINGPLA